MLIVKDQEKLRALAQQISSEMLNIFTQHAHSNLNINEAEPADFIYVLIMSGGMFFSKICNATEDFARVYAIEELDLKKVTQLMLAVKKDYDQYFKSIKD